MVSAHEMLSVIQAVGEYQNFMFEAARLRLPVQSWCDLVALNFKHLRAI